MKPNVTLSFSGTEFAFEADAASKLRRYVDAFAAAHPDVRGAPQREQLERTLHDRLAHLVRRGKTTFDVADVEALLVQLPAVGAPGSALPPRRRLYRVQQGRQIAGVCLGLAAYAQLDVALVRTLFVLLVGVSLAVYLIAMFVLPVVETVEQTKLAAASP